MGDSEEKRRRYCLMCNVFKPERCHHCSTCNRCVLNMDHHCPWINNCVGFWNRKLFLLLIFYVVSTLYLYLIAMLRSQIASIVYLFNIQYSSIHWSEASFQLFMVAFYFFLGTLSVMLTVFFKFHILLVIKNITTLESIEKKGTIFESPFDIGKRNNWEQIFGKSILLWFLPVHCSNGKPKGNGVNWPQKYQNEIKLMQYEDNAQQDETAEWENKKAGSLNKAGTINSQSQQASDTRVPILSKDSASHEADYYENIKRNMPTKKAIHKKQNNEEISNKVEVQDGLMETKKFAFKNDQKEGKYLAQH